MTILANIVALDLLYFHSLWDVSSLFRPSVKMKDPDNAHPTVDERNLPHIGPQKYCRQRGYIR